MKFKVGDTVRIKELNERERHHEDLSYVNEMLKYQGQIHQITQVDTRKKLRMNSPHFRKAKNVKNRNKSIHKSDTVCEL